MDISGSNLNQPVNFYQKNTGNNINYAIAGENKLYQPNLFMPEMQMHKNITPVIHKQRKRSKTKRLNTIDTDYLPDEPESDETYENDKIAADSENFFVTGQRTKFGILKAMERIISITPLLNYFFLRQKETNIKNTVNKLSNINQNVDNLMNTAIPFGEAANLYNDIAKNLTKAANIIGESNRKRL